MTNATARHILVANEALCEEIKQEILKGEITFEDAAKKHSSCPSSAEGGALGTFTQGQMVPEFDKVVFSEKVGEVHGPVQTQFGYHLLEITERND
jgi:peptidyl-prolyl cis-trans isomerase C